MNMIRLALCATALCALSTPLRAQDPSSPEARVKVIFRAFDLNGSGKLSDREVTGCDCRAYDADRNGEITWEEFRAGWTRAPLFGGSPLRSDDDDAPKPAAQQAPAAQNGFQVGDRVSWDIGGITFPGTIYNADGDRYQVDRDGYGRAREWVSATALTRLAQAPAQPGPGDAAGPAAGLRAADHLGPCGVVLPEDGRGQAEGGEQAPRRGARHIPGEREAQPAGQLVALHRAASAG